MIFVTCVSTVGPNVHFMNIIKSNWRVNYFVLRHKLIRSTNSLRAGILSISHAILLLKFYCLFYCSLPTLTIHTMDVGPQSNDYDCGVLAIAIAYDLCAGNNPLTVVYEHFYF